MFFKVECDYKEECAYSKTEKICEYCKRNKNAIFSDKYKPKSSNFHDGIKNNYLKK